MPATEPTRCILLTPPRRAGDGDVARPDLSQQEWEVTEFDDPALAMAELAVCERGQAARSAWGLERATRVVLAVDQPDHCPHLAAMLGAVARYMPSVAVWDCSDGQLRPMPLPTVAPAVRTSRTAPADSSAVCEDADAANISREELDMLLETGGHDQ